MPLSGLKAESLEGTTADSSRAVADELLALVPDGHLFLLAGLARSRLRAALLDELALGRGFDRSGPRLISRSPAWDSL